MDGGFRPEIMNAWVEVRCAAALDGFTETWVHGGLGGLGATLCLVVPVKDFRVTSQVICGDLALVYHLVSEMRCV